MKKIIKYLLAACVFMIVSCNDDWDEHYQSGEEEFTASPLNLLDYLKTQPRYSKFVEVLERTNVAEELTATSC